MTISALPPLPNPGDPVAVFNVRAFEFWASLPQFRTEANALAADVSQAWSLTGAAQDAAGASAEAAAGSSLAASASAELAASFAGAAAFSAVAIYLQDAVVFSPSNRMLYRRKSAGSSANDPAADLANWAPVTLSVGGNAVWHAGNFTPANYLQLTGGAVSGALSVAGTVSASGAGGFASSTWVANARNPIWRFGNSDDHGLSYFQGTAGIGGDTIGLHFGASTAAGSKFQFNAAGTFNAAGAITQAGNQVWHAGNLSAALLMYNRGGVSSSELNTSTGNGFYQVGYASYSTSLLTFNSGGSSGPVQLEFSYLGNLRWRNQTDSTNWAGWRDIYHTGNFDPSSYAPIGGAGASGTWGISITGKASTLAQGGGNGAAMSFHWEGQPGTPTWVWGGGDGVNHYVYSPSNFSVNYANSAGSCSGNAATATSAGTAGTVSMSAGRGDGTAYPVVWGTTGATSQLYSCANVTIQSSTGTLIATNFGGTHMDLSGNIGAAGVINSSSTMTAAGRMFANGGGSGLGAIYLSTTAGAPGFGADGDVMFVY